MNHIIAVFIGGGMGSLMRYGISLLVKSSVKTVFPLATLYSNVLSCFILAVTLFFFHDKIPASFKTFIIVGICGGFSTFSTFSYETIELMRTGQYSYAIINILINLVLCLGVIFVCTKHL